MALNNHKQTAQQQRYNAVQFIKCSKQFNAALVNIIFEYPPAACIFIVLIYLAEASGIAMVSQTELASLIQMNRKKVYRSIKRLIKDNYIAAARIASPGANTFLINPNLAWFFQDYKYRDKADEYVSLPSTITFSGSKHKDFYKRLKAYRKDSCAQVRSTFYKTNKSGKTVINYSKLDQHRIDANGEAIHRVIKDISNSAAKARNLTANYTLAIQELNLPKRKRMVAMYFIKHVSPVTFSMRATNHSLYERINKYLHAGYVCVAQTLSLLKNEGLITRKNGVISISHKLIAISKPQNHGKRIRQINKLNQLFIKRKQQQKKGIDKHAEQ